MLEEVSLVLSQEKFFWKKAYEGINVASSSEL